MTDLLAVAQGAEASRRAAWAQKYAADERVHELEQALGRAEARLDAAEGALEVAVSILYGTRRALREGRKPPALRFGSPPVAPRHRALYRLLMEKYRRTIRLQRKRRR